MLSQLRVISALFYLSHFTFADLNSAKEPFFIFLSFSSKSKSTTYEYYSFKKGLENIPSLQFTERKRDEDKELEVDLARELFIVLSQSKEKRKKQR